jgi:hypothetical protein
MQIINENDVEHGMVYLHIGQRPVRAGESAGRRLELLAGGFGAATSLHLEFLRKCGDPLTNRIGMRRFEPGLTA